MKCVHIMVDLETLALSSRAAIIQIGAVAVTPADFIAGGPGQNFKASVAGNIVGFDVDPKTIQWHLEKNAENYKRIGEEAVELYRGLVDFHSWVKSFEQTKIVWAKGTCFDIPILENAFKHFGMYAPWSYQKVRDFRTVMEIFKPQMEYENFGNHDALQDARSQMHHLLRLANADILMLE